MTPQLKAEGSSLCFPILEATHAKEKHSSCGLAVSPSSANDVDVDGSITRTILSSDSAMQCDLVCLKTLQRQYSVSHTFIDRSQSRRNSFCVFDKSSVCLEFGNSSASFRKEIRKNSLM